MYSTHAHIYLLHCYENTGSSVWSYTQIGSDVEVMCLKPCSLLKLPIFILQLQAHPPQVLWLQTKVSSPISEAPCSHAKAKVVSAMFSPASGMYRVKNEQPFAPIRLMSCSRHTGLSVRAHRRSSLHFGIIRPWLKLSTSTFLICA